MAKLLKSCKDEEKHQVCKNICQGFDFRSSESELNSVHHTYIIYPCMYWHVTLFQLKNVPCEK